MEDSRENKRALVIFASPNKAGHTMKMLERFLASFKEKHWHIDMFDVFDTMPKPCDDCGYCKKAEGCSKNDLDLFDNNLRQADILVVASPVYNFSFPAPFKALLDRTQRYFSARFSLNKRPAIEKYRKAVLLMTMGSDDKKGIEISTYQLNRAFSVMNTELAYSVFCQETDKNTSDMEKVLIKVEDIALEIIGGT